MFRFSLYGGGMGKGNPWKKDSLPIIRNAVSLYACACWFSKTLTFYLWKISRGGEGGVVSAPFRATFTKGDTSKKYFSVFFFVCLFVRLIIPSSQRKNGGGGNWQIQSLSFFFSLVNLSIGRFVYFPTFLRRIFSLFLKFVETSRKVENENFGDGGNELEPSTYRDTRIFLWSVHLRVENKSEVGPGLSGYCRVELPSPGVDAFSRGILCVFLLRKRGGRVRLLKFVEKLKGMREK